MAVRRHFNELHLQLDVDYPRVLVDLVGDDVVVVKRLTDDTRRSKVLVARMNYNAHVPARDFDLQLDGRLVRVDAAYRFEGDKGVRKGDFLRRDATVSVWSDLGPFCNAFPEPATGLDKLRFRDIWGCFVAEFEVEWSDQTRQATDALDEALDVGADKTAAVYLTKVREKTAKYLLLFSAEKERRHHGTGLFHVPGFGDLAWAGFAGAESLIREIAIQNRPEHPLVSNLLEGDYLLDYYLGRMARVAGQMGAFEGWFQGLVGHVKLLPRHLRPKYVFKLVGHVSEALRWRLRDFAGGRPAE